MAAALLERDAAGVIVTSAGTHALVGRHADPGAIRLMDERGLDIRTHVARMLTEEPVRNAQLVLAMTKSQCRVMEQRFPYSRGKIYRLGEHDDVDVVDPYQRSDFIFNLAMAQIEQGVSRWLGAIARLDE